MSGPFFEDLEPGWSYTSRGITLTEGHSAWYQAFCGDLNAVHVNHLLSDFRDSSPLNTALVGQFAIGQSTAATREVVANLFYQDVVFHRPIWAGTSISTTVSVMARSESRPRPDRPPRGKVLLRLETYSGEGELIMTMKRCALVRKSGRAGITEELDLQEFGRGSQRFQGDLEEAAIAWAPIVDRLDAHTVEWRGLAAVDALLDPVVDALQLVRVTGNLARAHRDSSYGQDGKRLVYGGHTIALAQAALSRMLPAEHVVLGWESTSHPAPVFESDLLGSEVSGTSIVSEQLTTLEVVTHVVGKEAPVQHWRPVVLTRAG